MTAYLLRRLGWAVVTLFIFVAVVFIGLQLLLPFDFSTQFAFGGRGDDYYAVRESLGLDRPLLARVGLYVLGLAQGDLGMSYTGEPVAAVIGRSLPFTLLVFAVGGILAYVLGEWLGRVAAWHRNRAVGSAATTASVFLSTMFPPLLVFLMTYFLTMPFYELRFALGLPSDSLEVWRSTYLTQLQVLTLVAVAVLGAVIAAFALRAYARKWDLRLIAALALPVTVAAALIGVGLTGAGTEALDLMFRGTAGVNVGRGSPFLAMVAFIILGFGEVAILMRTGMAEEASEDYVKTAYAKGLPGRRGARPTRGAQRHAPRADKALRRDPVHPHRPHHHRAATRSRGSISDLLRSGRHRRHAGCPRRGRGGGDHRAGAAAAHGHPGGGARPAGANGGDGMTATVAPETTTRSVPQPRVPLNAKIRIGLAMLAGFLVLAVARPILTHTLWKGQWLVYEPVAGWDSTMTHPAGISARHLLGSDSYGRDVFSMLSHSTWPTLQVALAAALVAGLVSTAFAAIAAYRRGPIDGALTHLADALVLLPPPVALFIIGVSAPDLQPPILGALYGLLFGLSTGRAGAAFSSARRDGETLHGGGTHRRRVGVVDHPRPSPATSAAHDGGADDGCSHRCRDHLWLPRVHRSRG